MIARIKNALGISQVIAEQVLDCSCEFGGSSFDFSEGEMRFTNEDGNRIVISCLGDSLFNVELLRRGAFMGDYYGIIDEMIPHRIADISRHHA